MEGKGNTSMSRLSPENRHEGHNAVNHVGTQPGSCARCSLFGLWARTGEQKTVDRSCGATRGPTPGKAYENPELTGGVSTEFFHPTRNPVLTKSASSTTVALFTSTPGDHRKCHKNTRIPHGKRITWLINGPRKAYSGRAATRSGSRLLRVHCRREVEERRAMGFEGEQVAFF